MPELRPFLSDATMEGGEGGGGNLDHLLHEIPPQVVVESNDICSNTLGHQEGTLIHTT